MEKKIEEIAVKIVHNLKKLLISKEINTTGKLSNSIVYRVSKYAIEIEMNQYGEFVDSGTKPHLPPIKPISEWVKAKGLNINPWAVAMHINKYGTKANPWINEFKRTLLNYDEEILDYMGILIEKDFDDKFRKIWQ